MTKVIVLSAVLGLSALGMACSDSSNTNVTVKPANVAPPVNVAPPPPPVNVAPSNVPAGNMKPMNAPVGNMKPSMSTSNGNMKK